MKKIMLIIILIALLISIFSYNLMPDKIASHWNNKGEVDGYMPKLLGTFLLPLFMLGMLIMFLIIPKIDPLKKNIEKFRKYFDNFILILLIFFLLLHIFMTAWNLGYKINPNLVMPLGLSALIYYISIMLKHAKRNWFIGIRTPWTLSSDKVWKKTHDLGSKLYKLSAIIILLGWFFPNNSVWFILIPILVSTIIVIVYSYLEYNKK